MREPYYECPHCRNCFTADEWNKFNSEVIIVLGRDKMPEGIETESSYDCPSCEERVEAIDIDIY